MKNTVALIDTNVILDILLKRSPFKQNAVKVLELCVNGKITGYIAAHSIPNLFYILRKDYTIEERKELLKNVLEVLQVAGVEQQQIMSALDREDFKDFEDCLQMECAKKVQADYIITRNIEDFQHSDITVLLPDEFIRNIV